MDAARVTRALAWFTVVVVVADAVVSAQSVSLTSETAVAVHGFPFVHGAVVGSAVLGALVVARYDRHPIGWLLSVVGALGAVSLITEAYAYWVQEHDGPGPAALAGAAAWISTLFGGQLIIAGIALMFLLAPDGHLLSRRWRYAAWLTGFGAGLCMLAILSTPPATFRLTTDENDMGPARRLALTIGFLAIIGGLVASVVSMLVRLRHSEGEQRQQLRLIALATALPTGGVLCLLVVQMFNGGHQTWAAALPLFVSYFLLPILFAVAVMRHRLYELDVIINRTLVLTAGVAFAGVGYTVLVVLVGRLALDRTGGFWLSLIAITVVALAFQPLRRGVVHVANRLAYGSRAQPYEALAEFSRRLADAPSAGTLLPAVAEAAARAVSAAGAAATLDVPGSAPVAGSWGVAGDSWDYSVPVRHQSRRLGRIDVALPPGRSLTIADLRLLEGVADQAAMAFGNTVLAGELAGRVDELDRTARQLTESRLRIVEADDAARRALETAISRQVLPYLTPLPERIRAVRSRVARGITESGLDGLVLDTNLALEELRDLTRGVFPTQLARAGLGPAVRSLLARGDGSTVLTVDGVSERRFSPRVEGALYFCCSEAVRAGAGAIRLAVHGDDVALEVDGLPEDRIIDLQSMTDRVDAVGGTLTDARGRVRVSVPVDAGRPDSAGAVRPVGVGGGPGR